MLWLSEEFIAKLQYRLLYKLPGLPAQLKMAPPHREDSILAPSNAKLGGVMIVLFLKKKKWHILLMRRTKDGGTHSGQISLPGGKHDKQDGTITYTAIRELSEEMGINASHISIIGALTPLYIPPSNFLITPIVSVWHTQHALQPSHKEVQEVIEISLDALYNSKSKKTAIVYQSDSKNTEMYTAVYSTLQVDKIWGATAMVLSELEALLHLDYDMEV